MPLVSGEPGHLAASRPYPQPVEIDHGLTNLTDGLTSEGRKDAG